MSANYGIVCFPFLRTPMFEHQKIVLMPPDTGIPGIARIGDAFTELRLDFARVYIAISTLEHSRLVNKVYLGQETELRLRAERECLKVFPNAIFRDGPTTSDVGQALA